MLDNHRNLYLGFHGCEKDLAQDIILKRKPMKPSENSYDWLGSGIYFWENDPFRAYEFARDVKGCAEPFVIGAILDLGYCLDLTCRANVNLLTSIWKNIVEPSYREGRLRANKPGRNKGENGELMLRFLDRFVIETLHKYNREKGYEEYDSVRAGFWEGDSIYPTAGFMEKSHIQICIRNYDCISGVFVPDGFRL